MTSVAAVNGVAATYMVVVESEVAAANGVAVANGEIVKNEGSEVNAEIELYGERGKANALNLVNVGIRETRGQLNNAKK